MGQLNMIIKPESPGVASEETMMFLRSKPVESDEHLWMCFREGNHQAYTLLLRKHASVLHNYGSRFSKDEDLVKDCLQDVFFELWHRRERIKQTLCVKAYLFKALRLRILREQSKWKNTGFTEGDQIFDDVFNIEAHLIHEQTSKEITHKLREILSSLSERQKKVLHLYFFDDVNHDGIASTMGLNRQSAYNLLYRSICNLRKKAELVNFF